MRLDGGRQSDNVEDGRSAGGMGGRPIMLGGGMGVGGILILLLLMCLGVIKPQDLLNMQQNAPPQGGPGIQQERPVDPEEEKLVVFTERILASTEDVWNEQFQLKLRKQYQEPKLHLFSGEVKSACGYAEAAVGPFYCPADKKVYLDLSFYNELQQQFRAPGDFAQAYVVAHEIGHHVQNQLGISAQVQRAQSRASKAQGNELSVRLELQADYLAGVWAHHAQRTKNILEPGDVEEGLRAASAIGDDKLQMQSRGYVVPDSFTHGSSKQRLHWFREGLKTGEFSVDKLESFFSEDEL